MSAGASDVVAAFMCGYLVCLPIGILIGAVLSRNKKPVRTVRDVARELLEGVDDRSIVLRSTDTAIRKHRP